MSINLNSLSVEEIENFLGATMEIISGAGDDFSLTSEKFEELVYPDGDDNFTEDEEEARGIFNKIVKNLNNDDLGMYSVVKDDEDIDYDSIDSIIKALLKERKNQKEDQKDKIKKKNDSKNTVEITSEELFDFFSDLNMKADDDKIFLSDYEIIKKPPTAETVNKFLTDLLEDNLDDQDIENLSQKSIDFIEKVKGCNVKMIESEPKKRGRKPGSKIEKEKVEKEESKENLEKEEVKEANDEKTENEIDDIPESLSKAEEILNEVRVNSAPISGSCGGNCKCKESKFDEKTQKFIISICDAVKEFVS